MIPLKYVLMVNLTVMVMVANVFLDRISVMVLQSMEMQAGALTAIMALMR